MEEREYLKCLRCNRKLKNKEAKRKGYGPHCWQLYQTEIKKKQKPLFEVD